MKKLLTDQLRCLGNVRVFPPTPKELCHYRMPCHNRCRMGLIIARSRRDLFEVEGSDAEISQGSSLLATLVFIADSFGFSCSLPSIITPPPALSRVSLGFSLHPAPPPPLCVLLFPSPVWLLYPNVSEDTSAWHA